MAIETQTISGFGDVTADVTGTVVAVQTGGPAGAWSFKDGNGPMEVTGPSGKNIVFAAHDKATVDAIVTAFNAP